MQDLKYANWLHELWSEILGPLWSQLQFAFITQDFSVCAALYQRICCPESKQTAWQKGLKRDGKDAQSYFKILKERLAEAGVIHESSTGSRPCHACNPPSKMFMMNPPRYKKKAKQDELNRGKDEHKVQGEGTLCIRIQNINGGEPYIYIKFL